MSERTDRSFDWIAALALALGAAVVAAGVAAAAAIVTTVLLSLSARGRRVRRADGPLAEARCRDFTRSGGKLCLPGHAPATVIGHGEGNISAGEEVERRYVA